MRGSVDACPMVAQTTRSFSYHTQMPKLTLLGSPKKRENAGACQPNSSGRKPPAAPTAGVSHGATISTLSTSTATTSVRSASSTPPARSSSGRHHPAIRVAFWSKAVRGMTKAAAFAGRQHATPGQRESCTASSASGLSARQTKRIHRVDLYERRKNPTKMRTKWQGQTTVSFKARLRFGDMSGDTTLLHPEEKPAVFFCD